MAVGDETIGFGGTIEVNDGMGDAFVIIDKPVSLAVPNWTLGTVDSKRLDLDQATIVKLPTLLMGESFVIKYQHTNAGYIRFQALLLARAPKQWRITIPDDDGDTEITLPGILTTNKVDPLEADKITEVELTVVVSGPAV